MRIPQRPACEALCEELGAMLYQLHWAADGSGHLRAGNGFTAHIYWPLDPADPYFHTAEPLVSSYRHGATPQEATENALQAVVNYDGVVRGFRRPGELLRELERAGKAIDQLITSLKAR